MTSLRYLWAAALCAVVCGCAASDGGPVGTGISASSASISGNLIDVQDNTAAGPAADTTSGLPAVRVSIDQAPGIEATTDSDGNFQLDGDFSGHVTLRFAAPQFQVTQGLDVPAGAAIVLEDIELSPDSIDAQAVRQLDLTGHVVTDCMDDAVLIDDLSGSDLQFMVQLTTDTIITRQNGQAAGCADIHAGDTIEVQTLTDLSADLVVTAVSVTIAPLPPSGGPQAVHALPFGGHVAAIDCDGGFIVLDDMAHRTRLRVSGDTVFRNADGSPAACTNLALGDRIDGEGLLSLQMPGFIEASTIILQARAATGDALRFFGFVAAVDCDALTLLLRDVSTAVHLQLSSTTLVTRPDDEPLPCPDIQVGDRIIGVGTVSADQPDVIEALRMTVTSNGQG
jgi:hypothetical protein